MLEGGSILRALVRSMVRQGFLSHYRKAYWKFLIQVLRRWRRNPEKASFGFSLLISGHHFITYARTVVADMDEKIRSSMGETDPPTLGLSLGTRENALLPTAASS
jgi:hypothetical protein